MSNLFYYKMLGFTDNKASIDEIKKAYRSLSKTCHPDLFPDQKDKIEEFKSITEAYEILSNPIKRKNYDELGFISEENDEEDIKRNAERAIVDLFREIFDKLDESKIDNVDIVKLMKRGLDDSNLEHLDNIENKTSSLLKYEKAIKRIKSNSDKNLILDHLNSKVRDINKEIEGINRKIRILDAVRELLKDYKYEINRPIFLST